MNGQDQEACVALASHFMLLSATASFHKLKELVTNLTIQVDDDECRCDKQDKELGIVHS